MNNLTVSASPHITSPKNSTRGIMLDVILALMPVLVAATYFFGYHVVINAVVCIIGCAGTELLYSLIISRKWNKQGVKEASIWDLSCVVTALILALNLPSVMTVSGWGLNITSGTKILFSFDTVFLCLIGSIVAIALVKMLFGGIGRNFANPALTGRIFLFLAFASAFAPVAANGLGIDATTSATWLGGRTTEGALLAPDGNLLLNMFFGNTGSAAVGETCVIALLIGYVYLSIRRVIDFRLPLIIVGAAAVFSLLLDGLIKSQLTGTDLLYNMLGHVMSGGLIFGAIFMATDYATSPNTFIGNVIYGVGIALITVLIRVFAAYPEGMSFAVIIMNITVPLIDKYIVPKPFGATKETKKKLLRTKDTKSAEV